MRALTTCARACRVGPCMCAHEGSRNVASVACMACWGQLCNLVVHSSLVKRPCMRSEPLSDRTITIRACITHVRRTEGWFDTGGLHACSTCMTPERRTGCVRGPWLRCGWCGGGIAAAVIHVPIVAGAVADGRRGHGDGVLVHALAVLAVRMNRRSGRQEGHGRGKERAERAQQRRMAGTAPACAWAGVPVCCGR